jgi:general secretion pathway protein H
MPILATGSSRWSAQAGVTLVEMMVALFVAGMVAGAVLLMAPSPERTQHDAARRLAARMTAAGDESILLNRRIALVVSPEGYGFDRFEQGGWVRISDGGGLSFRAWPRGVALRPVDVKANDLGEQRVAYFDPVTGANPAQIVLEGERANWAVSIDKAGAIHVDPAS